ncbi:MAG: tRNA (adenosine(37)-N6)-dimethylallyltransferase MiaA [Candidatus Shapirobacteria bacterium]|jgi:tRNA dimethylallyltransferase
MPNIFNKILIISGPTATGKTSLACILAKKFNGELISADSRQIYRGLDIGTGKDHHKDTVIHLIDIIKPNESYSVAQYRRLALEKIKDIHSRGKLPIVVGGTGLYIDSIVNYKETFSIKPNNFLRFFLNIFPLKLLQLTLRLSDFKTFRLLNNSDCSNPHRLIRKIEIRLLRRFSPRNDVIGVSPPFSREGTGVGFDFLHLSLTAPNSFIFEKIIKRVGDRLKNGLLEEIETLLKKYKWTDPGLNTLAYKEFAPLKSGKNLAQCITQWQSDERKYVRRQKTWFKKQPNIYFIDITQTSQKQIINIASKWYNKS